MEYALAIMAQKYEDGIIHQEISAEYVPNAKSEANAIERGILKAKEMWPTEKGWYNHGCSVCLIERK